MTKNIPSLLLALVVGWELAASTGCSLIVDGQLDDAPRDVRCEEEPDGTECGAMTDDVRRVCVAGTCRLSQCGDGVVDLENDEQCDEVNDVAGDGCEPASCQFSCNADTDCDDGAFCTGAETCDLVAHVCVGGTPPAAAACVQADTSPGVCNMGQCVPEGCGDNTLDVGEECDDGNLSDDDGCDANCTFSCTEDADCDDADVCTGVETCDVVTHTCLTGTPLVCPPALDACHLQGACEPGAGCPAADALSLLIDGDLDGHAATSLGACGTDCNDADNDVYPGNLEVCGDGKDNNCINGQTDEVIVTWYADCDADGYALSGATSRMACAKPPRTALSTGCPNDSGDWTTRNPNSTATRDCRDQEARAFPGAFPSSDRTTWPTTAIPGTSSWDWNCDLTQEFAYGNCPATGCVCFTVPRCITTLLTCCTSGSAGWADGSAPNCGVSELEEFCGAEATSSCADDRLRLQRCR